MLELYPSSRFERSFKKLPTEIKQSFARRIDMFREYPYHPSLGTHKLHGNLEPYHAFYLKGGFRVLFEFQDSNIILLVNIGNHNDYERWARSL